MTPFAEEFPCRFFDVGIAEQHAVTFAAGLAAGGLRPVVAVYSTFLQRAYDQIVHDVCLPNLPVVFALDRAGLVGEDGETHHGSFDLAYLGHVPNLTVMAPSDAVELAAMVRGTADLGGPAAIRYPRGGARQSLAPGGGGAMRPGTARVLRGGGDVALIAIGSMVETALDASDILRSRGVSASVVDSRFLRPLAASDILGASANARLVVTLEEGTVAGGFGAAVTGLVNTSLDDPPRVLNLGLPPRFVGHGRAGDLLAELGLDAGGVAKSVLSALPTTQHQTRRAGHRG